MSQKRPKHLALWQIRLPLPGIVSILHRISGLLMFVAIPAMLYALEGTLSSAERFEAFRSCISNPIVKIGLLAVLWGFLHHACAGTRFLFLDVHKGLDLPTARLTAKIVLVVSLLLTVVIGVLAW
ncbi:succinate dehydrogenase, cytochrome b556 subunit [Andreprevotia chitinilytica]|uniref:succinate dehydrogenase, cytochrome b556 subunit n=1 Tax=Andreprevotia chitinilytica TaxID=396808 RepID=UPI0005514DB0|nr:succinate dehydrogenase, cytochrome b556 subunit [Andreprevotia chitinilytica]